MVKLRSGRKVHGPPCPSGSSACCKTLKQASSRGHLLCCNFYSEQCLAQQSENLNVFRNLARHLDQEGGPGKADPVEEAAGRVIEMEICSSPVRLQSLAIWAVHEGKLRCLELALRNGVATTLDKLPILAMYRRQAACLERCLDAGAPWHPHLTIVAAMLNYPEFLDVTSRRGLPCDGRITCYAACCGHVRFLERAVALGHPLWTQADEPDLIAAAMGSYLQLGSLRTAAQNGGQSLWGHALLFAASVHAPLTEELREAERKLRQRCVAFASCFTAAGRLQHGREGCRNGRRWASMACVPADVIMRIATLAQYSIACMDIIS